MKTPPTYQCRFEDCHHITRHPDDITNQYCPHCHRLGESWQHQQYLAAIEHNRIIKECKDEYRKKQKTSQDENHSRRTRP